MTIPSEDPRWAESGTAADPGPSKRAAGYVADEALPFEWLNHHLRTAGRWIRYLAARLAALVLSNWTERDTGITNQCQAIVYADTLGLWVASFAGALYRATDPAGTWSSCSAGSGIVSITWGNGVLVAVGASGEVLTSTNGTAWTSRTPGTSENIYGAAYGDGVWIVVGGNTNGLVRITSDFVTWSTPSTPPSATSIVLNAAAYSPTLDLWVIIGDSSSYLWTAANAAGVWTQRNHNASPWAVWKSIVWDGVAFYAVGRKYGAYSTDGVTWSSLLWLPGSLDTAAQVIYSADLRAIIVVGFTTGGAPLLLYREAGVSTPEANPINRSPATADALVGLAASDRAVALVTDANTNAKILTSIQT